MPVRNTGSVLTDGQGNNRTGTHLSTNIVMIVDGNPIGAIQEININEERPNIKMIDEIGTDGHIDSAPSQSTNYTIGCKRIRYARMRIAEAFSRGFVHVKSQRIPFDIMIHDQFHDANEGNAIITTIKNCWIKKIGYVHTISDWTIVDDMAIEAEDMFSVINGNNVAQVVANGREQPIYINSHEAETDRGGFRGSLSASGLLDAFNSDPTGY